MPRSKARGVDPETIQRAQRRDRQAGIVELMPPEQPRRGQIHQAALVLIDQPAALDIDVPFLAGGMAAARACRFACRSITAAASAACSAQITGTPRLMMPAFSAAIFGQRVAEKFGVIDADRRDDAGQRLVDHVGGVEPAAEADFEQHHIGRMLREQTERRGGLDFEHGDRLAGIDALAMQQRVAQFVVADQDAAAGRPSR